MASTDIRRYNFGGNILDQYIWQDLDFDGLVAGLDGTQQAAAEGGSGAAVLAGGGVQAAGGLNYQVAPTIGTNSSGRVIYLPTATQVTMPVDGTNPSKSLIVLRPLLVDGPTIPKPTDPLTPVPLYKLLSYSLLVLPGTPAGSPAYPTPGADDIVVMGVMVPAAAVTLTNANLDRTPVSTPRPRLLGIKSATADYAATGVDVGEDIIEVDSSAGPASGTKVTLPPAVTWGGKTKTVIKVDSSAKPVLVAGNGAETISGQATQVIDDQWGSVKSYSNGQGWRVF